jgi:hypothetical protein
MDLGFNGLKAAIAVSIVAAASVALAQPGGGRGMAGRTNDLSFFLAIEPVQNELQLTDEQKASAQKMADDNRQAMMDLRNSGASPEEMGEKIQERAKENKKKVDELLKPEQRERLEQIALQIGGGAALSRPEIADKLGLSDEQKKKLQKLSEDAQQKRMDLFSAGPPSDPQEMQDRMQKVQKINDEQKASAMEILTAEQKDQFNKMQGKKFDFDPMQLMRGFGRGAGGGGQGGAK